MEFKPDDITQPVPAQPQSFNDILGGTSKDSSGEGGGPNLSTKNNLVLMWISLCIIIVICGVFGYLAYQNPSSIYLVDTQVGTVQSDTQIPDNRESIKDINEEPVLNPEATGSIIEIIESSGTEGVDLKPLDNAEVESTIDTTTEVQEILHEEAIPDINTKCPDTAVWNGTTCQELSTLKVLDTKTIATPPPIDHTVFAAGGYNGRELEDYIDDSGHNATIFDVFVDYSEKPVVLVLGAYEPSIWNISISKGTKIEKIILGGYHNQEVSGIFTSIPIERHIYETSKSNDYFYIIKGETTKGSLKRFGEIETLYYPDSEGKIVIGNQSGQNTQWIQDPKNIPENYYKHGDELGGKPGLDILVQKGILRVATEKDAEDWFNGLVSSPTSILSMREGYPITDKEDLEILRNKYTPGYGTTVGINYYVVVKDAKLPGGMYWAFAFYVPKGITLTGDISNGSIYDFNTLQCQGPCSEMNR
ncbi:hypothetical protein KBD33_02935 [Candidatus Gracilibacteria bacterium]|nr:hypothetical protein [Candidatus Gracilibacteria bacterium]